MINLSLSRKIAKMIVIPHIMATTIFEFCRFEVFWCFLIFFFVFGISKFNDFFFLTLSKYCVLAVYSGLSLFHHVKIFKNTFSLHEKIKSGISRGIRAVFCAIFMLPEGKRNNENTLLWGFSVSTLLEAFSVCSTHLSIYFQQKMFESVLNICKLVSKCTRFHCITSRNFANMRATPSQTVEIFRDF